MSKSLAPCRNVHPRHDCAAEIHEDWISLVGEHDISGLDIPMRIWHMHTLHPSWHLAIWAPVVVRSVATVEHGLSRVELLELFITIKDYGWFALSFSSTFFVLWWDEWDGASVGETTVRISLGLGEGVVVFWFLFVIVCNV